MNWKDASFECKRRNPNVHLVHIESEEENEFVSSLIFLYDDSFWMGLSDEDEEGKVK